MKIPVELSSKDVKDVIRFSGEKKKGTAIRKFIVQALMLQRRRETSCKVLNGELKAELTGFEDLRTNRNVWGP